MVNNINFNPFTGQAFSAAEIQKLDTNKDGIISQDELFSNINFISQTQSQDAEGEVQIDNSTPSEKKSDSAIKTLWEGDKQLIQGAVAPAVGVVKGTGQYLGGVGGFIGSSVSGVWAGTKSIFSGIWRGTKSIFASPFQGVGSFCSGIYNGWKNIFQGNIWGGITSFAKGIGNLVWKPIAGIGKGIASFAKGVWGFGSKVVKGIGKGIGKVAKGIGKAAKAVGEGVVKGVKAIGKGIANVGKAIGKGIKKIFSGW